MRTIEPGGENIKRAGTGIQTYRFYTNILLANKAICAEAEELLHSRQTFVVLSYQWPSFGESCGGLTWLPVVSKKHVDKMKYHSMRLHLSTDKHSFPDIPVQSCIIIAEDLAIFTCAARAAARDIPDPGPAVTVGFSSGVPTISLNMSAQSGRKVGTMRCLCDLRATKYRSMDNELQHRLLAPLASIISPSQRVVFTGKICNSKETEHLKQLMGPSVACAEASLFLELETCMMAKEIADSRHERDELSFVLLLYTMVYVCLHDLMAKPEVIPFALRSCPEMVDTMEILMLDILINISCCALKCGRRDAFDKNVTDATFALGNTTVPIGDRWAMHPGMKSHFVGLDLWSSLYLQNHAKRTVGDAVRHLDTIERLPHQQHDLEILKRYPNHEMGLSEAVLPFSQCSISQLPFPKTSFYKNTEGYLRHTPFRGWHNFELIRSLDKDTKTAINTLQKQHGLQVTAFDQD